MHSIQRPRPVSYNATRPVSWHEETDSASDDDLAHNSTCTPRRLSRLLSVFSLAQKESPSPPRDKHVKQAIFRKFSFAKPVMITCSETNNSDDDKEDDEEEQDCLPFPSYLPCPSPHTPTRKPLTPVIEAPRASVYSDDDPILFEDFDGFPATPEASPFFTLLTNPITGVDLTRYYHAQYDFLNVQHAADIPARSPLRPSPPVTPTRASKTLPRSRSCPLLVEPDSAAASGTAPWQCHHYASQSNVTSQSSLRGSHESTNTLFSSGKTVLLSGDDCVSWYSVDTRELVGDKDTTATNATNTQTLEPSPILHRSFALEREKPLVEQTLRVKVYYQANHTRLVFSMVVRKAKLKNVESFVEAVSRKVVARNPEKLMVQVGLAIFFKNHDLEPIYLKQPGENQESIDSYRGLILEYLLSREKVYISSF